MKQIHGIFAVTVTHFQENGEIDYAACAKHINWLIESGVHGLLPLGATGEFSAFRSSSARCPPTWTSPSKSPNTPPPSAPTAS